MPPLHTPGEELELSIEALVSDGRGLARRNGIVFLVDEALPGQHVQAQVTAVRARMIEARSLRTLSSAPDECCPTCSHKACGSCEWQCLEYASQLKWKRRLVRDALERLGHIPNPPVLPVLPSPQEWGYRNKMAFAFAGGGNVPLHIGMRRRRSRELVEVTDCRLQSEKAMRTLAALRELLPGTGLAARSERTGAGYWRFAVVRESGNELVIELIASPHVRGGDAASRLGAQLGKELRTMVPQVTGFVLSERKAASDVAQGEIIRHAQGRCCLCTELAGMRLEWNCGTFFQVNTGVAEVLCKEACRMLAPVRTAVLWDLYCGVGGIGLSLAPYVRELYGLESSEASVACARKNAQAAGSARCRFETGDAAEAARLFPQPDLVVADPPRAGLDGRVLATLLRMRPSKFLYVSCNPATLARDAAMLEAKYRLVEVQPLDMFPQTPHVECLALFVANRHIALWNASANG